MFHPFLSRWRWPHGHSQPLGSLRLGPATLLAEEGQVVADGVEDALRVLAGHGRDCGTGGRERAKKLGPETRQDGAVFSLDGWRMQR